MSEFLRNTLYNRVRMYRGYALAASNAALHYARVSRSTAPRDVDTRHNEYCRIMARYFIERAQMWLDAAHDSADRLAEAERLDGLC